MNDRDSEMHEFTLSSANKYKDGTPIYADPSGITRECVSDVLVQLTKRQRELSNQLDESMVEYDAVLKTHGDTLEEHLDRICELEGLYEHMLEDLCAIRDRLCKITDLLVGQNEHAHIFSNFCGNCIHAEMKDGICTCELSGELIDPDSASCSLFDPSFTYVGKEPRDERPDWLEKIRKTMTTPSEPSVGCADCKHARNGMCVKYNCSLGAICATPECHESYPF